MEKVTRCIEKKFKVLLKIKIFSVIKTINSHRNLKQLSTCKYPTEILHRSSLHRRVRVRRERRPGGGGREECLPTVSPG